MRSNPKKSKLSKILPKIVLLSFLVFSFSSYSTLNAQEIKEQIQDIKEDINKRLEKPFSISGSIGINFGLYESFGIPARRDNFSYLFLANMNLNLLGMGIDVPLDGNFSQLESSLLQPFNQIGISPRYKWITAHLGYRNMTFSPLTLNGHTFLGIGLDLAPPIKSEKLTFRLSTMYGQLRRPITPLAALEGNVQPVYRRMGYGVKVGVAGKKKAANYIDLIVFKGYDELNSIQQPLGNDAVKPEDNLVLGASGQYQLFKGLTLKADWAISALTQDSRSEVTEEDVPIFSSVKGVFTPRISTQVNQSVKSALSYSFLTYNLSLKYNRIAPDYRTLGSYFFQNDLEEYTFNAGALLKEGKTSINGSIGFQENNLNGELENRSKRVIGSVNVNQVVSPKLNVYATYSNFSSSLLVVKEELSDSLDFYQVTTGYTIGANYNIGTKERQQSISGNLSYQTANSRDEYSVSDITTEFITGGLFYNWFIKKKNIGLNAAINYTRSNSQDMISTIVGPGIGLIKKFPDKKISLKYYLSYRTSFQEGDPIFNILQNRIGADYKITKHHILGLKLRHLYKIDTVDSEKTYSEIQGVMTYRFVF